MVKEADHEDPNLNEENGGRKSSALSAKKLVMPTDFAQEE